MDGQTLKSGADVGANPGANWHVIGSGDFNGDGKADILWQNTDGQAAIWLMDGQNLLNGANVGINPGAAWHVQGTGDFNGDGKADIAWQNTDGTPAVWLMDGFKLVSGSNVGFNPGTSWHEIPPHHDVLPRASILKTALRTLCDAHHWRAADFRYSCRHGRKARPG